MAESLKPVDVLPILILPGLERMEEITGLGEHLISTLTKVADICVKGVQRSGGGIAAMGWMGPRKNRVIIWASARAVCEGGLKVDNQILTYVCTPTDVPSLPDDMDHYRKSLEAYMKVPGFFPEGSR